ncbi:hypothetical protein PLICRDRAFT_42122 [Plicaturopsis crispa FD-325 SS-3]|nr:hypothetical protein PLICRDRAFT_42122 [Plicaturopsis crispa FD-325 SS-3]
MSRSNSSRPPSSSQPPGRRHTVRLPLSSVTSAPTDVAQRPFVPGLTTPILKAQRTSKTSQKLVVLPSAPQTKPLRDELEDEIHGYETDAGVREHKSAAERMSKEQRKRAGFRRLTAYCVAEEFRMKLLAGFLKREHNVLPRVFDEAVYAMYHLPLLPGYGRNSNIRSSVAFQPTGGKSFLSRLSEAEENGYQGTYFSTPQARSPEDGYITSSSPVDTRKIPARPAESDAEQDHEPEEAPRRRERERERDADDESVAEVVYFAYGVVVFYGLDEGQEKGVLEDLENAGIMKRRIPEDNWEVEECHFAHDPYIAYPRIYNDFFTFKSHSHLLKLSVAHAFAQSTLLAHYEANALRVLSDPRTLSIPTQLATTGSLNMKRKDALRLTGRLFKLRRDVNLVSNVLDVPELFWSEASLGGLYNAVREYMEIDGRVQVLNEKIGTASAFLDAIHDHLNENAMARITWIVIWLIVAAIVVDLGEVLARLIVHATTVGRTDSLARISQTISREDALRTLEQMMLQGK